MEQILPWAQPPALKFRVDPIDLAACNLTRLKDATGETRGETQPGKGSHTPASHVGRKEVSHQVIYLKSFFSLASRTFVKHSLVKGIFW